MKVSFEVLIVGDVRKTYIVRVKKKLRLFIYSNGTNAGIQYLSK